MSSLEVIFTFTISVVLIAVTAIWMFTRTFKLEEDYSKLYDEVNNCWTQIEGLKDELSTVKKLAQSMLNKTSSVHLDDEMEAFIAARRQQMAENIKKALAQEYEFFTE
jgi:cell division protein FtsL